MPGAKLNPHPALRAPQSDGEIIVSVRGLTKVFKDFWNRPKARGLAGKARCC